MRGRSSATRAGRCHSRAVLGPLLRRLYSLATTMDRPSGLKAKESGRMGLTPSSTRGGPTGRPVAASLEPCRLFTIPGKDGLAVGAVRNKSFPGCGHEGWAEGLSGESVNQPGCPVSASYANGPAICAERGSGYHTLMCKGLSDRPTSGGIPQPRRHIMPAVRTVFPSGLKDTELTTPPCSRGSPMGSPVLASHSRAVSSSPPARTVFPSGLKASDLTPPPCVRGAPMGEPVTASHSPPTRPALP